MEHKPRVDLQAVADLSPVESRAPMSREERLVRWVEALEREPKRILRPLHGIEFRKPDERRAIRADNSPERPTVFSPSTQAGSSVSRS